MADTPTAQKISTSMNNKQIELFLTMEQTGNSQVVGLGSYLPEQIVKSNELMEAFDAERRFGLPDRYISTLAGVRERRFAPDGSSPSDLAIEASLNAINHAGIEASEIDYVIYCGIDRDWLEPATAHRVQHEIGADRAACFDVTNACHGLMNGLAIGDAFIGAKSAQTILVCTAELGSTTTKGVLDLLNQPGLTKERVRTLVGGLTLGDAGGAIIIRSSENNRGFRRFSFSSAGKHAGLCYMDKDEHGRVEGYMDMQSICSEAINCHRELIENTYEKLNWSPTDVNSLILHQAGMRPHKQLTQVADIDQDRAPETISMFGNLASATIPVVLDLNKPAANDNVLILSTGSGISVGQTGLVF